jgi:hypothetical protein
VNLVSAERLPHVVSRELTAELRRRALLSAAFPADTPLERARRPIGELRAAVSLARHHGDVLDDRVAGLVEALVQEADPFSRAVAWDSLLDGCSDVADALSGLAFSIRQARLQLNCARIIDEARRG